MKKSPYNQKYFEKRDYLDPKIASAVENLASEKNSRTILDVGCGTGKLVKYLNKHGFRSVGCDPYYIKNQHVKLQKNNIFVKASATNLPFENKSFDLVASISVVEHLEKTEVIKFLTEAERVLKSRGCIFLVTPNYNSVWRMIQGKKWFGYSDPTHINFYTSSSLSKLLKENGFQQIKFQFKTKDLSFIDYLLVSTPLWRIRDSFYVSAQKQ